MTRSPLWDNRDFQILSVAQGLSRLGTQISAIALPLLALRLRGSPVDAAAVAFAGGLTQILTLLPGGSMADRLHRRAVAIGCDIGCLLAMGVLGAAILFGHPPLAILIAVTAVTNGLGGIFHSTSMAILRRVVSDGELAGAVAVNQARNAAVYLAGPPVGGMLFYLGAPIPFLVDAASFALSLAGLTLLRAPLGRAVDLRTSRPALLKDLTAGISFLWRQLCLRWILVISSLANCAFAGILFTILIGSAGLAGSAVSAGFIIGCAGAGALVGSFVAVYVKELASPRTVVFAVVAGCAALTTALAAGVGPPVQALVLFLCALLAPTMNVIISSGQMLLTPDQLQGRMQAATSFLSVAIQPLGPVAAGVLLSMTSLRLTFLAFTGLLTVAAMLSGLHQALRHLPDIRVRARGPAVRAA